MPQLKKPDIPAVLDRTNLALSLESFLLPTWEGISNAIHSVNDRWGPNAPTKGRVVAEIHRNGQATTNFAEVRDNGDGLTSDNYESFITPFSGHKLKYGGKGFGRFISFKVFQQTQYASRPSDGTAESQFTFDVYKKEEVKPSATITLPLDPGHGLTVRHTGVRAEFDEIVAKADATALVTLTVKHFLPTFIIGDAPQITLRVDDVDFDLRDHFREFFNIDATHEIDVPLSHGREKLDVTITRIERSRTFNHHSIIFFANGRVVGSPRDISNKIGSKYFTDENDKKYVVVACVSGTYLDNQVNVTRTALAVPEQDAVAIVGAIADLIETAESAQIATVKTRQSEAVAEALLQSPLLRLGLRGSSIEEYVKDSPNSWGKEEFVGDLAKGRFREQAENREYIRDGAFDHDVFREARERILSSVRQENQLALAEYVVHRRSVIDLAEALVGMDENTTRMQKEDAIHDVIYPRYTDSEQTRHYSHNLWLIDDRLAFVGYISSDRTLHGGRRQKGDKITDLALFDDAIILQGGDRSHLVLVELKRPGRDDYEEGRAGKDPVKQILDTADHIRERGSITTSSGKTVTIPSGTPILSYLVADLEPSLLGILKGRDFDPTWDDMGYFRYHKRYAMYMEVLSYDKLIADAKKRNAAFFELLLGDTGA